MPFLILISKEVHIRPSLSHSTWLICHFPWLCNTWLGLVFLILFAVFYFILGVYNNFYVFSDLLIGITSKGHNMRFGHMF